MKKRADKTETQRKQNISDLLLVLLFKVELSL